MSTLRTLFVMRFSARYTRYSINFELKIFFHRREYTRLNFLALALHQSTTLEKLILKCARGGGKIRALVNSKLKSLH